MFFFITGIILFVIALIILPIRFTDSYKDETIRLWPFAGIPLLLALIIFPWGFFTQVSAKNVGVVVTYGKVSSDMLKPGIHTKAPWSKVVEIDGTIQTDEYKGKSCLYARIGDGSRACVSLTVRWHINPEHANDIYQNFRSNNPTEHFRDAVVSTQLKAATQDVLSAYNPIAQLQAVGGDVSNVNLSFAPDYDKTSADIAAQMKSRSPLADIDSVTVSYVSLADSTQKKLNDYVAAIGDTRIAAQKAQTAKQQAEANRTLSASVNNDPNVLVSKCLDTVADAVEKGVALPAGYTCWPGGGSAVVVPSK